MSEESKKDSNWMQNLWRPAMGWMYMLICLLDMAVFPVLWSLLQASMKMPITQWNPLTLQGAGLFHIAMGAVLGIAAFGRTQEKLAGTAANPTTTVAGNTAGGFGNVQPTSNFGGTPAFGAPQAGGFGAASSFGSPAPVANSFGAQPLGSGSGFGGAPGNFGSSQGPSFGGGFGGPVATTASGKKIVPDEPQPLL